MFTAHEARNFRDALLRVQAEALCNQVGEMIRSVAGDSEIILRSEDDLVWGNPETMATMWCACKAILEENEYDVRINKYTLNGQEEFQTIVSW